MRGRMWAIAIGCAAVVGLMTPVVLYAHARLKSSSPANGAHLSVVPRELRLNFSEVPELTFTKIELIGPTGRAVALGPVAYAVDSKRSVVVPIRGGLSAGDYTVNWQVAGDDGHPVRDRFRFVIAAGAAGVSRAGPETGSRASRDTSAAHDTAMSATAHHDPASMPEGNGFGAESALYVILRWFMFVSLLLVIGPVAFRQLVLRLLGRKVASDSPMLDDAARRAARIGHRAAGALLIILVLRLVAQSAAMHGQAGVFDGGLIAAMVRKTMWGWSWLLQLVGTSIAAVGFHMGREGTLLSSRTRRGWGVATLGAIVLAFTPGFGGHAVSVPRLRALTVVADGLHVMGGGGWLGSLTVVLLAGIPAARARAKSARALMVAELVNAFSPTALMFAGLVAASGLFAAWIHVGSIPAIWQTKYGQLLLVKLGVLSVLALTGAYNWLRVKPSLGRPEGAMRIRRSGLVEVTVGVIVLLITAILVATPTAMDMKM